MKGSQVNSESIKSAAEFLMQEQDNLYALHREAKGAGETRLNFFMTFCAAVSTVTIAAYSFVVPELRALVLGGVSVIVLIVGLITYRKMLQLRVATIIYRRRQGRIRAWFAKQYPSVIPGLPYGVTQDISMNWGASRRKLGSTAFSVAAINTALVVVSVPAISLTVCGSSAIVWAILGAIVGGLASWLLQLWWKNRWFLAAETRDREDLRILDEMNHDGHEETSHGVMGSSA
jgi:hypothetical protein